MSASIAIELKVNDKGSVVVKKFTDTTVSKVKQMSKRSANAVEELSKNFTSGLGGAVSKVEKGLFNLKTAAVSALTGWGFSKILSKFATFESAMADMGKVTDESFGSIKNKIMDLPNSLGSSTELVKGYYQVLSAGVKGSTNQINTLITASKLAKTAHTEQATAITGLSSVMDAFKTSSMDAANALQTMEKTGKTTVGGLIPIIGQLSSSSAALGINLDEMGAAFAAMTLQSGGTEKAATQYKALLVSLLSPTAEMAKLLKQYGGAQAAIKKIGFGGVLDVITKATHGNTEATKKLIGSTEGYLGFLGATANKMKTYNQNLEEQKNKTGAVDKAWKNYQKTLNAIWDTFKNTIGKQVIWLGEKLAPAIKSVLIDANKWLKINRQLIAIKIGSWIDKIVKGITGIVKEGVSLTKFLSKNYKTVKKISVELIKFYAIAKVVGGLTFLATFFETMSVATGGFTASVVLLNKAMKGSLPVLSAYAAYKTGEFIYSKTSGLSRLEKEIKEDKAWSERLKKQLAERQQGVETNIPSGSVSKTAVQMGQEQARNEASQLQITASQVKNSAQNQIKAMISVAETEKKLLTKRLSENEKFYSSLADKIKKNADLEKKHITELMGLYKQKEDIQKSADQLTRELQEKLMTPIEKYQSGKSALDKQYSDAILLSGQEQVKALEEYKQAVSSFANTYSAGIKETSTQFGVESTQVIVSSNQIIQDAIQNIQLATEEQKNTLDDLAADKQKQIESDQIWGDSLSATARDVADDINTLQDTIAGLSNQIESMAKTVTITGIDKASPVVDTIQRQLNQLHDKTITITTVHNDMIAGRSSNSGVGDSPMKNSYRYGTDYVPATGLYQLHQGEQVISSNKTSNRTSMTGDIIINVPESAVPQRPEDWREITRTYIKPELERLNNA